jgi:hypothetical protein
MEWSGKNQYLLYQIVWINRTLLDNEAIINTKRNCSLSQKIVKL